MKNLFCEKLQIWLQLHNFCYVLIIVKNSSKNEPPTEIINCDVFKTEAKPLPKISPIFMYDESLNSIGYILVSDLNLQSFTAKLKKNNFLKIFLL